MSTGDGMDPIRASALQILNADIAECIKKRNKVINYKPADKGRTKNMEREECEGKISELMTEIWNTYKEYNPDDNYCPNCGAKMDEEVEEKK